MEYKENNISKQCADWYYIQLFKKTKLNLKFPEMSLPLTIGNNYTLNNTDSFLYMPTLNMHWELFKMSFSLKHSLQNQLKMTNMHIRNRDTYIENKHIDTKVGSRMDWEIGIDLWTILYVKWMAGEGLLYSTGGE